MPSSTVSVNTAPLNRLWPANRQVPLMRPSSLAQAITEPDSEIAPISAPMIVADSGSTVSGSASISATAAIEAAAPPPMPLYSATICGIAVIATRLPLHHAHSVPSSSATAPSTMLVANCGGRAARGTSSR